jgi:hypothetical protein
MLGGRPDIRDARLARFFPHSIQPRVGRELPDGLGKILVECVATLLLDFSSLRGGCVTMTVIEAWFFHEFLYVVC